MFHTAECGCKTHCSIQPPRYQQLSPLAHEEQQLTTRLLELRTQVETKRAKERVNKLAAEIAAAEAELDTEGPDEPPEVCFITQSSMLLTSVTLVFSKALNSHSKSSNSLHDYSKFVPRSKRNVPANE
jgi:hypothetical protein